MSGRPIPVYKVIDSSSQVLKGMLRRIQAQQKLLHQVRGLLPETVAEQVEFVSLRQRQLYLTVSTPAWAHRFKYLSAKLKQQLLNEHGLMLDGVEVRVGKQLKPKSHKPRKARPLSKDSAELLESTADGITNTDLQAALKRLAKRTSNQ